METDSTLEKLADTVVCLYTVDHGDVGDRGQGVVDLGFWFWSPCKLPNLGVNARLIPCGFHINHRPLRSPALVQFRHVELTLITYTCVSWWSADVYGSIRHDGWWGEDPDRKAPAVKSMCLMPGAACRPGTTCQTSSTWTTDGHDTPRQQTLAQC